MKSTPVTFGLLIAIGISIVLSLVGVPVLSEAFRFATSNAFGRPWSFLTYPFAGGTAQTGVFWAVMGAMFMWSFCSMVERDLGGKRFAAFFAMYTALAALCVWAGAQVGGVATVVTGPFLPASAIGTAWCARNQRAQLSLMGFATIPPSWMVGLLAAVILAGNGLPIGLFALIPLALAWFWATDKLPIPYAARRQAWNQRIDRKLIEREEAKKQAIRDEAFEREKARKERERLRQLFEGSIRDDPSDK